MSGPGQSVAADPPAAPRRPRGWRWAVPVAAAAAGALLVSSALTAHGSDLRTGRRTGLADLVEQRQQQVRETTEQVAALEAEVARLADAAESDRRLDARRAEIERLAGPAGLTAVTGPSLTVTLDDAPRPEADGELGSGRGPSSLPDSVTPDDLVVHQQDVQAVVNALWAGGAEAMQLMDQRVIATSAVRCVGNTLVLQGRVYSPPFTVTAIGDVTRMREALERSPGVRSYRQWVEVVGLGYRVEDNEETTVPAYAGGLRLPVTEREPADGARR